jgi:gamma-glutamyltranspeptidase/glutathione hydrolase
MAPTILTRDGQTFASLGASGGRRIINALAQLVINVVNHGLSMQPAITAPRIDASTPDLFVSARLPRATREDLAAFGHQVVPRVETPGGGDFASPVGILRDGDGLLRGGADPFYPATAIGINEVGAKTDDPDSR